MDVTATQKELWSYCSANDFISKEKIADFQKRLTKEGKQNSLDYALEEFEPSICPKCNADGAYKWHFLGKHNHPACNVSWYVTPGKYIGRQIKASFRAGRDIGGEAASKESSTGGSIGMMLFGFIIGFCFRLPYSVLLMPVQAVFSLTQKKD
jgi:hypothetical protein